MFWGGCVVWSVVWSRGFLEKEVAGFGVEKV